MLAGNAFVWSGNPNVSLDWKEPSNWVSLPGGAPGYTANDADDAIFPGNALVFLNESVPQPLNAIFVSGASTELDLQGSDITTNSLQVPGGPDVELGISAPHSRLDVLNNVAGVDSSLRTNELLVGSPSNLTGTVAVIGADVKLDVSTSGATIGGAGHGAATVSDGAQAGGAGRWIIAKEATSFGRSPRGWQSAN